MQLSDKAMLASLNITQWTGVKYDKKMSKDAADKNGISDASRVRTNKSLIAKEALEEISKLAGEARTKFYELSLPWDDNGTRIITSAAYHKLANEMRQAQEKFYDAKDKLVPNYPSLVDQAEIDLNGAFNRSDYLSQSEFANRFRFAFRISPLPTAEDFRVQLSDAETDLIQRQITANAQESVSKAMENVFQRVEKALRHMATSLKDYKVTDGKQVQTKTGKTRTVKVENNFHDTVVTNIRELLDILPVLNLTDDARLVQLAKEIKPLVKYDASTLKDNDGTRETIAQAAEDILSKMSQFV